jgi:hypothetical protein
MLSLIDLLKDSINNILVLGITPLDYDGCGNVDDDLTDLVGKSNYKEWSDYTKKKLGVEHDVSKVNFIANNKFIKREHSFLNRKVIKDLLNCASK